MKKISQIKIAIIFFICVLQLSAKSQSHQYFIINGKVISESNENELGNGSIQIIKNNQKAVTYQMSGQNCFRLELEYNAEYQLIFTKEGNQKKTIIVNTEVPDNLVASSSNFPHFLMAVKLLTENKDQANFYSENQTQYVSYSSASHSFAKIPTVFEANYVEKEKFYRNSEIQIQENEAKLQEYKMF